MNSLRAFMSVMLSAVTSVLSRNSFTPFFRNSSIRRASRVFVAFFIPSTPIRSKLTAKLMRNASFLSSDSFYDALSYKMRLNSTASSASISLLARPIAWIPSLQNLSMSLSKLVVGFIFINFCKILRLPL